MGDPTESVAVTSEELARRIPNNDEAAVVELWQRHREGAWRIAVSAGADPAQAEDAVAEAFWRVVRRAEAGHRFERFGPYLSQAVRNEVRAQHRRFQREIVQDDVYGYSDGPVVAGGAFTPLGFLDGETQLLSSAVQSMSERDRTVVWLSEVEGYKPAEIAEVLDIGANNAAQLVVRAKRRLRTAWVGQVAGDRGCGLAVDTLMEYVLDQIDAEPRRGVEAHLAQCEACASAVEDLQTTRSRLPLIMLPVSPAILGWLVPPGGALGAAIGGADAGGAMVQATAATATASSPAVGGGGAATTGQVAVGATSTGLVGSIGSALSVPVLGTVAAGALLVGSIGFFLANRDDTDPVEEIASVEVEETTTTATTTTTTTAPPVTQPPIPAIAQLDLFSTWDHPCGDGSGVTLIDGAIESGTTPDGTFYALSVEHQYIDVDGDGAEDAVYAAHPSCGATGRTYSTLGMYRLDENGIAQRTECNCGDRQQVANLKVVDGRLVGEFFGVSEPIPVSIDPTRPTWVQSIGDPLPVTPAETARGALLYAGTPGPKRDNYFMPGADSDLGSEAADLADLVRPEHCEAYQLVTTCFIPVDDWEADIVVDLEDVPGAGGDIGMWVTSAWYRFREAPPG